MRLITHELIGQKIFLIREHKVMLDRDLAKLYGVQTKVLNQAVKRNAKRFPRDFMFQLSKGEFENWRSQIVTSKSGRMGLRRVPFAFTEHGILMLSSVLNSKRAISVNITIMRVFVKLRQLLSTHKELSYKLSELERKIEKHDVEIQNIFEAIHQLMTVPEEPKRKIGFHPN